MVGRGVIVLNQFTITDRAIILHQFSFIGMAVIVPLCQFWMVNR